MENELDLQKNIIPSYSKETQACFVIDIPKKNIGDYVSIAGIVESKKNFRKHGFALIGLKDITGSIAIKISIDIYTEYKNYFYINNRIKLYGIITEDCDKSGNTFKTIKDITNVELLIRLNNNAPNSEYKIGEKESSFLLSRVIDITSRELQRNNFFQFESKLISTYSNDDGLEPLYVVYPGFGAPAVLITSPAAQIIEFLLTSFLDRAFTVSTSFASTYRFPNFGTEAKVIVAKAFNMHFDDYKKVIYHITKNIFSSFGENVDNICPNEINGGNWENNDGLAYNLKDKINFIQYDANIPVHQKNWYTKIESIHHIYNDKEVLLIEGTRELFKNTTLSTIVIYPTQFLSAYKKNPMRRIRNLWRISNEK